MSDMCPGCGGRCTSQTDYVCWNCDEHYAIFVLTSAHSGWRSSPDLREADMLEARAQADTIISRGAFGCLIQKMSGRDKVIEFCVILKEKKDD